MTIIADDAFDRTDTSNIDAQVHCRAGVELLAAGNIDAAEAAFQAVLKWEPKSLQALVGLGNVAWAAKVLPLAEKRFKAAAAAHPDSPRPRLRLIQLFHTQKRWSDAEKVAVAAATQMPCDFDLAKAIGRMRLDAGNFGGAVEALAAADGQQPDDPAVSFDLARALLKHERFDDAEARYRQCIDIAKPEARLAVLAALALLAGKRGDPREAKVWLEQALELAPEEPSMKAELARTNVDLARRMGDRADVQVALTAALKLLPTDVRLLLDQAELHLAMKQFADAEACFGRVLAVAPHHEVPLLGLGAICLERGDKAAALGWFEKARAAHPATVSTRLTVGRLLVASSRYDEAEAILRSIPADDPTQPMAQTQLAEIGIARAELRGAPELLLPGASLSREAAGEPSQTIAVPQFAPPSTKRTVAAAAKPPIAAAAEQVRSGGSPGKARHVRIAPATPTAAVSKLPPPEGPLVNTEIGSRGPILRPSPAPSAARSVTTADLSDDPIQDAMRHAGRGEFGAVFETLVAACIAPSAPPKLFLSAATVLAGTGDLKKAQGLLRRGLDRYPGDIDLWTRHAQVALAAGDTQTAEGALASPPSTTSAAKVAHLLLQARLALSRWSVDEAGEFFAAVLAIDRSDKDALAGMAHLSLLHFDLPGARHALVPPPCLPMPLPGYLHAAPTGGRSKHEQILADFAAQPQLIATLAALGRQNPWQRIVGFSETCRRNPESFACALALLIEMRQSGYFDQPADSAELPDAKLILPIPRVFFRLQPARDPAAAARWSEWVEAHPTFRHIEFDAAGAAAHLRDNAATRVLQAFEAAGDDIRRAAIFRLSYLYSWGGISVATDLRCQGPIDSLLAPGKSLVASQTPCGAIDDGLVAVAAHHPVIGRTLDRLLAAPDRGGDDVDYINSGSANLTRALAGWISEIANGPGERLPQIAMVDAASAARVMARAHRPSLM